jgi:hypothetical protein
MTERADAAPAPDDDMGVEAVTTMIDRVDAYLRTIPN